MMQKIVDKWTETIAKRSFVLIQSVIFLNLFYLTINMIYMQFISPVYFYAGFYNNFSISNFFLAYSFFLVIAVIYLRNISDPKTTSDYVLAFLFLIAYCPSNVLFSFGVTDKGYFFLTQIYWFYLGIVVWLFSYFKVTIPTIPNKTKENISIFICVLMCGIILYIFGKYSKFTFMTHFLDVYGLRKIARTYKISKILTYLFGFARASIPIYLGYEAINRRWGNAFLLMIIQYCNYSVDGSKSIYSTTLIVLLVAIFYNFKMNKFLAAIAFFGVAGSHYLYKMGFSLVNSYIVRRMFFLPQLISYCYYDYNQTNPLNYFNSLLRYIGLPNYKPGISYLIGEIYYGNPEASGNTGLFGDAYWNLGIIGVIALPILIGIILFLMDQILRDHHPKIVLMIAIIITIGLQNSALLTLLLSHGMLIQAIVLLFLPMNNSLQRKRYK